jgi:hypothetical protein
MLRASRYLACTPTLFPFYLPRLRLPGCASGSM